MSEKHLVCHGAICTCKFGTTTDKLHVKSQSKHYINDKGEAKLTANTKDIGQPFTNNTFGNCKKLNNGPCTPNITEWKGYYDKITLKNKGKVLLEDSTATCAVGGPESVSIIYHGQVADTTKKQVDKASSDVQSQLNPLVNIKTQDDNKNQLTAHKIIYA